MKDTLGPALRQRRWGLRIAVWILAVAGLWPRWEELSVKVELDSNEGWNAVWADRLARGDPIYFGTESLLANNYPPLSFHILAAFPDPLLAGRWLALAGLLATAIGVGWVAWRTGGDGVATAGLLVAFMTAHHAGYVAMNDPQWLGHAIMTAGLVVLVAGRGARGSIAVAAGLMLTAGLIKHSLLPLPLAVTWWLWREGGHERRWWLASAAGALALGLAWMRLRHGPECLLNILDAPRGYSWWAGGRSMLRWSAVGGPLLIVAGMGLRRVAEVRWRKLAQAYMVCGAAWAALTIGGDGVDRNVYFDLVIAATLAAGWALAKTEERLWRWAAAGTLASIVYVMPMHWSERSPPAAQEAAWADDIAWLRTQPGPVAAHRLGLVHWSGHRVEVETFLLSQRLAAGRLDPARVTAADLHVWQLPRDLTWPLPAGPAREAWLSRYEESRTSANGRFFVRRANEPRNESAPR